MSELSSDSREDAWALSAVAQKDEAAAPSATLSWWAKIGLTGIVLSLLAPLVGVAGLWTAAGLGHLAALGLETSRAKLPMIAMDPNWDLRVVYAVAVALLGLRVAVSALPRPTWRIAGLGPSGLWFVSGAVLWATTGTALAFERYVVDLSDGIHLVFLGATALWTSAVAIWLITEVGHAVLVAARIAARRWSLASGMVAVVGVTGMAVATPVLANPEVVDAQDVYRDAPVLGAIKDDVYEAGNMLANHMVDAPPSSGGEVRASDGAGNSGEPEGLFASCMEALVEPRPGERSSIQDAVMRSVSARYPSVAHELEDVVRWQMIDMCVDGRERSTEELRKLLFKMTRNAAVSRVRKIGARGRYWSRNVCLIDETDELSDFEDQEHREVTVARLLGKLPTEKRALLEERFFEGLGYAEMAERRGKSQGAVSRATVRAQKAFRQLAASECF